MSVTQPDDPADTARLPTQHAVHIHVRTLLDARGYVTRAERIAFMAEVLGRELRWPYEITVGESDRVLAALQAGLNEPNGESWGEMP